MKKHCALLWGGLLAASSLFAQKPSATAPKTAEEAAKPTDDAEYRIGPQDVLQIDVWKEAEITGAHIG